MIGKDVFTPLKWKVPAAIRSRIALEIAAELVVDAEHTLRQVNVLMREQASAGAWSLALFASSGIEGIEAVAKREAALAIVNPANMLMLAYRGKGPFKARQPVRTLTVLPSHDQFAFIVRPETGLKTFEEIASKQCPLRVALRGQPGHSLHYILDDIFASTGLSAEKIWKWGGEIRREGLIPIPGTEKFQALIDGRVSAIFDEGAKAWVGEALDAGMKALPLAEETVARLEEIGYRRSYLKRSEFPQLEGDLLSVDYSGWPVFVHEELPDDLVRRMCAALEARRDLIPWEGDGPLPLDRMCREADDTPQLVPYHRAAEAFWKERGYL